MRPLYGSPLVVGLLAMAALSSCVGLMEPRRDLVVRPSISNPFAAGGSAFYPLDVGNHWSYENVFRFQITPAGGTPGDPSEIQSTLLVDLVGTEERYGRTYVVQRESDGSFEARFLYRQDRSGLYNADPEPTGEALRTGSPALASRQVPGAYRLAFADLMRKQASMRAMALHGSLLAGTVAAQDGPLAGEIAILRYPLAASKTWHVREDPLVVYTVEKQEALDLPAGSFNGWKIQIGWPGTFGPNDRAWVWYGREGMLKLQVHAEGEARDDQGNLLGTIVSDQIERLSDLSLVGGS